MSYTDLSNSMENLQTMGKHLLCARIAYLFCEYFIEFESNRVLNLPLWSQKVTKTVPWNQNGIKFTPLKSITLAPWSQIVITLAPYSQKATKRAPSELSPGARGH